MAVLEWRFCELARMHGARHSLMFSARYSVTTTRLAFSGIRDLHSMKHFSDRASVALALLTASLGIAGCSKNSPEVAGPLRPAGEPVTATSDSIEVLDSQLTSAGTQMTYRGTFVNGALERIAETRAASAQTGEYQFRGARLLHYAGPSSAGDAVIDVQFNMQGAVISATSEGQAQVPTQEISAVRTRAELLRNHALAQRSVRSHQTR
jgi:hypothetical protein